MSKQSVDLLQDKSLTLLPTGPTHLHKTLNDCLYAGLELDDTNITWVVHIKHISGMFNQTLTVTSSPLFSHTKPTGRIHAGLSLLFIHSYKSRRK